MKSPKTTHLVFRMSLDLNRAPLTRFTPNTLLGIQTLQTLCQCHVALPIHDAFDRDTKRFRWSHQDDQLCGAGEPGVQQVAAEQQIMLYDYVGWILLCQEVMWFDVFFRGPHPAGVRVRAATEKLLRLLFTGFQE